MNVGGKDIFIFDIEEDVLVDSKSLYAFSRSVIQPSNNLDLLVNPYIPYSSISNPDRDVTIHSDGDIWVNLISSDDPERWIRDHIHPWNGATLPNGGYTQKYRTKQTGLLPNRTIEPIPVLGILGAPTSPCICTSRTLFNNGCICGHVKKQKWGLK
jgi:hypothetical protein